MNTALGLPTLGVRGTTDEQKKNAQEKADEGKNVDAKPDEAKKKREEEEKASREKKQWERDYANAGLIEKGYMKAKKYLFSWTNLLAKAAKWIWKKMIAPAIKAVKKALGKVMNYITDKIMSGVLFFAKQFMSDEDAAALDETFAQMKEQEAAQAEQAAAMAKEDVEVHKKKQTDAEKAASDQIAHCKKNVATGTALVKTLDDNDTALQAEETKATASIETFKGQYGPYFQWVDDQKEQAGVVDSPAGPDGTPVDPSTQPLSPKVGKGLEDAGKIVTVASSQSQTDVTAKSLQWKKQLDGKADSLYDGNTVALRLAAVEIVSMREFGDFSGKNSEAMAGTFVRQEEKDLRALKAAAAGVHTNITRAHNASEQARQAKVSGILGQAKGLADMDPNKALAHAQSLADALAKEAGEVESAKASAFEDMRKGYIRIAEHKG